MEKKLQEKQYYLDYADKIVSRLSCETVDEKTIVSLVKHIEPYHYEEIVEERFVSKLCGYCCCGNELKNIPTKKYQISTKFNTVYELSDRKRYCSPECFKSSKYLEAQISTVPVWLRNTKEYLKGEGSNEIKLWSSVKNKAKKASSKDEPKLSKAVSEAEIEPELKNLHSEIESELKQIENEWMNKFKINESAEKPETVDSRDQKINIEQQEKIDKYHKENELIEKNLKERSVLLKQKFIESMEIHRKPSDLKILKQIFLFQIKTNNTNETTYKELGEGEICFKIDETSYTQLLFIEYIIKRIDELLSPRTKAYLLGKESKTKPSINEEREREEYLEMCDKFVAKNSVLFNDLDYQGAQTEYNSYQATENDNGEAEMIAKLKGFENLFEPKNESNNSQEYDAKRQEFDHDTAKKPLPDYEKLKEESIQQQLKIKEFFSGTSVIKNKGIEEVTVIDENDLSNKEYNQNLIIKIKETNEEFVRVLPTVDSKSQNEIRRRIFYDKLIKYLEQLLKFSEFNYSVISNSLKNHVKNFVFSLKLTNENIIFSSNEWPIVTLFILKILSLKASLLNRTFEDLVKNDKLIDTILSSFKLNQIKLEAICVYLIKN